MFFNKFFKSYKNKKSMRQTKGDWNLIERTDSRLKYVFPTLVKFYLIRQYTNFMQKGYWDTLTTPG